VSKLNSVIRHEYMTIVRQPSFWIAMVATPLIIGAVILLTNIGNQSSAARIEELAKELRNVAIIDESTLINEQVVTGSGLALSPSSEKAELIEAVRDEKKAALVVYPEDLAGERTYDIYLSSNDLTINNSVHSLANNLLETSVFLPLGSADVIALAQNGAETKVTTYHHGEETAGINEYIVPGLFVVLFYIVFMFSVGYMLTSVSEEKENRSMEMVLTYVKPRHLIVGKLLAVTLVTFTQIAFFILLAGVSLLVMHILGNTIALPAGISLEQLVFDPVAIAYAAGYFVVGFLLFAGFMTATAAAAPSSKEANNFSAVFYVGAFIPFYFIMTILTDPENPIVRFLTFFPITSPVVSMVRNAVGNMGPIESALSLIVMTGFMVISIWVAVRAFSLGALEFSQTIKLRSLFSRKA